MEPKGSKRERIESEPVPLQVDWDLLFKSIPPIGDFKSVPQHWKVLLEQRSTAHDVLVELFDLSEERVLCLNSPEELRHLLAICRFAMLIVSLLNSELDRVTFIERAYLRRLSEVLVKIGMRIKELEFVDSAKKTVQSQIVHVVVASDLNQGDVSAQSA